MVLNSTLLQVVLKLLMGSSVCNLDPCILKYQSTVNSETNDQHKFSFASLSSALKSTYEQIKHFSKQR